jgi:hypothetical protein
VACGCGAAMTQRRSSPEAQAKARPKKKKEVLRFFLGPVRKEIPDLQPKRYAQLARLVFK